VNRQDKSDLGGDGDLFSRIRLSFCSRFRLARCLLHGAGETRVSAYE
jgi:hypothetical protein